MKNNLKIYECDFKGVWPVDNCLILAAYDHAEAKQIAKATITHTQEIKVRQIKLDKPGVIVYLSGEY